MTNEEIAKKIVDLISKQQGLVSWKASDEMRKIVYGASHLTNWKIDPQGLKDKRGDLLYTWPDLKKEILKVLNIGLSSADVLRQAVEESTMKDLGKVDEIVEGKKWNSSNLANAFREISRKGTDALYEMTIEVERIMLEAIADGMTAAEVIDIYQAVLDESEDV